MADGTGAARNIKFQLSSRIGENIRKTPQSKINNRGKVPIRYRAFGLLATTLLAMASQGATVDYIVSKETNGFNVNEVTKDTTTLLSGSPFGSSLIEYVWTDLNYIYVVNLANPCCTSTAPIPANVLTYSMSTGKPEQIASYSDPEIGVPHPYCGTCSIRILDMFASPQHLFMKVLQVQEGYLANFVHMYHTYPGGSLKFMCDIQFPINPYSTLVTSITSIRVDSNEIYAYINYTDPNTLIPETGIYDISVDACKQVAIVPQ